MSIEIKGVIIGEGKPKVCVPIVESQDEAILNKLKEFNELEVDMIELRIDFYENIHQEDALRNLFLNIAALQIQKPIILTIRTAAEGGEVEIDPKDYFNVYKLAVEANAFDIYDVELALGTNMAIELRTLIHDAGKYMLMSSHNFDRTPEVDSLMQKFRSMDSLEADIMKVAVMPEDYQDLLNLLSFTVQAKNEYTQKPIVTMSMSAIGLTSRLVGEQFGSAITFASVGKASAPGQIDYQELNQILEIIHKNTQEA
ncbi:MAG: type I 3-dehydroquinate dehydratase [Faecalibacillus sp.]|uniref:type I 3-dehydroquinate dehydratase n=1 Tax=Faecalibacillus sp. TaxID=2678891 RepID=UPI00295F2B72|nr:type I 3-dehydroquinate dehydratase [uncultured Faecalibacillus sp.]MBS7123648.1 type I 3-dehydroquinate dehydratase [Coprobacillus sp.]